MANPNNHLVIEFSNQVHHTAQQLRYRLRDKVETKMVKGEDYAYDSLNTLEAVEVVSRHQSTQGQDIEHNRRRLRMREFVATIYLDRKDEAETLVDPQRNYAMAVARSMYRKFDAIAVEAAFATVKTGKTFGTDVTFTNDGGFTINATAGLTYEKLLEAEQNYINADVGTDQPEESYIAISGKETTALKQEVELTSGDFTRYRPIDGKQGWEANGFEVVNFAGSPTAPLVPILPVSGTTRDCMIATKRGICIGISAELSIEIDKRTDLNNNKQVLARMMMGGVRTEGKHIQKLQTTI